VLDSTALRALQEHGAAVAGMHPLQTFSGIAVPPLDGKIFAIEGDAAAVRVARQIVRSLGGSPVRIARNKKVLYHAAAAMAAGHVLAVEEAATQLLISIGMTRKQAVRALLPLTRQVLENFERLGPRKAWTGPLSRGDYQVVEAHLKALQESPAEFAGAYDGLSRLAARVIAQDAANMLAELARISAGKKAKTVGGNA
jgi:predicted short-subunit dehydrogenase-like oxidoreductase (DUF2520 family)